MFNQCSLNNSQLFILRPEWLLLGPSISELLVSFYHTRMTPSWAFHFRIAGFFLPDQNDSFLGLPFQNCWFLSTRPEWLLLGPSISELLVSFYHTRMTPSWAFHFRIAGFFLPDQNDSFLGLPFQNCWFLSTIPEWLLLGPSISELLVSFYHTRMTPSWAFHFRIVGFFLPYQNDSFLGLPFQNCWFLSTRPEWLLLGPSISELLVSFYHTRMTPSWAFHFRIAGFFLPNQNDSFLGLPFQNCWFLSTKPEWLLLGTSISELVVSFYPGFCCQWKSTESSL